MKCFGDKGKIISCKIILLDEQELTQEIPDETLGQNLLDVVFQHLNLLETSYFGLRYIDQYHQNHWLDPKKKIVKQLKGSMPFAFYFSVKFYAADPTKLVEEITRYQFFLQIKQDILQGRLSVPVELVVELGALAVQSELGDYDPGRHLAGYISEFRVTTCQNGDIESKISELHKSYVGQVPAKAEINFLEKVKWLDMYGVDLHPVLGEDNTEYFLGLTPTGIIVLRNKAKVGNYFWPRITKVYFRGLFFMLRVKDKNSTDSTYGFETPSKSACKHLWKCCVEHHAFFRLTQAAGNTPQAIFSLGSKFRYSGRTEKEVQQDAKLNGRHKVEFSRSPSRRYQSKIAEANSNEQNQTNTEIRTVVSLPSAVSPSSQQVYRSTSLTLSPRSVSPHSTRSVPFHATDRRNLSSTYDNTESPSMRHSRPVSRSHSPRSAKSSSVGRYNGSSFAGRTSSVESQSSVDSRSYRRRQGRSRCKLSDGESEASSKCSSRGHRRHKHRRRHRQHSDDSSDQRRHHRKHRHRSGERNASLVESSMQWAKVQAGETPTKGNQATVRNLANGYSSVKTSNGDADSCKKHRKHRSTSPADSKSRIPDEIRRHIEFSLKTTEGLSESQLKEIPYTEVNTAKAAKIRNSRSPKRKKSPKRKNSNTNEAMDIQGEIKQNESQFTGIRENNHDNGVHLSVSSANIKRQPEMNVSGASRNSEIIYQNEDMWKNQRPPQVNTLPKRSQIMPLSSSSPHFDQNGQVNNTVWTKPPLSSQDSGHGRHNGYSTPHADSPESGIGQYYRNSASSNNSGVKDYSDEMSPGFVDSYKSCYLRQNRIARNENEDTRAVLKPQSSPQSSVTSGISVGSSSTSTPMNESVDGDHVEDSYKDDFRHFSQALYPNSVPNIHLPATYSYKGAPHGINGLPVMSGDNQREKIPLVFSNSYPMMDPSVINGPGHFIDQNTVSHVIIKESGKNARYISYVNSSSVKPPMQNNNHPKLADSQQQQYINSHNSVPKVTPKENYMNNLKNERKMPPTYYPDRRFPPKVIEQHQETPRMYCDTHINKERGQLMRYYNYPCVTSYANQPNAHLVRPYNHKIDI